ncbi:MAG: RDD family protein [Desulfobacterales bacterium]|nr:RDD family protein [Desulfobacterales bacterium]
MNLYYADGDRQVGPIGKTELQSLIRTKKIDANTLVWQPGMTEWQALGIFVRRKTQGEAATREPAPPAQQSLCSECGQAFAEDDMIRFSDVWVCSGCKPIIVQKIKEGVAISGAMDYAGFWLRFGAWFIDYIILGIISMVIYLPITLLGAFSFDQPAVFVTFQVISTILNFVLPAAYEIWFVGKYGATPGKMACKIKVVTADGQMISYGRSVGRHFAKYISGLILGIGYIMAGFDDQKRSLHDRICDTRVIKSGEI